MVCTGWICFLSLATIPIPSEVQRVERDVETVEQAVAKLENTLPPLEEEATASLKQCPPSWKWSGKPRRVDQSTSRRRRLAARPSFRSILGLKCWHAQATGIETEARTLGRLPVPSNRRLMTSPKALKSSTRKT